MFTHLYGHWGEVPHVDHDGPARHHPQQVADHVVFAAVPEGVAEPGVVLKTHTELRLSLFFKTKLRGEFCRCCYRKAQCNLD